MLNVLPTSTFTFIEFGLKLRLVACKVDIWALGNYERILLVIWVASCKTNVKLTAPYRSEGGETMFNIVKPDII
jgi:hypothetical protein